MGSMVAPSRAYDLKLIYFPHKKDAIQFTNVNLPAIQKWIELKHKLLCGENIGEQWVAGDPHAEIFIDVENEKVELKVCPSDWIVREENKYFVMKDDFFSKHYEPKKIKL